MKSDTSIVYLWAEVTGYVLGTLEELTLLTSGSIDVVHWDSKTVNSTQYRIEHSLNLQFHARSQTNDAAVLDLLVAQQPSIIVVSGWMDKGYVRACKSYKRNNPSVKVIACIDDQWTGSARQRFGQVYYAMFYKKIFDFMWVCGHPQYSYAQRFGYGIENIISNLYSADTKTFNLTANCSKRFVYVGRFVTVKALDVLVEAYSRLTTDTQEEWPLVLIGDGDQKEMILSWSNRNIKVMPFMQPNELKAELLKGGVACLPSHKDQWGVVVHEYALLSMPMLLSTGCGAATEFLIPGYNGFMFEKGNVDSLHRALQRITELSNEDLLLFGKNSARLGSKIDCELSAQSLLSVVLR